MDHGWSSTARKRNTRQGLINTAIIGLKEGRSDRPARLDGIFIWSIINIEKGCYMKGTISQYKELNGFGWIFEGFNKVHFFHVSNWNAATIPVVGAEVEFEIGPGRKPGQTQAVNVVPIASQTDGGAR